MNIGIEFDHNTLTTHCLTIGMTGSGKTGLGMVMLDTLVLEECIPVLVFDLKGDLCRLQQLGLEVYVPESGAETPPETEQLISFPGTVIYLAHLSALEQAQLITKVLWSFSEWMMSLGGSSELKALIHIDEIHGLVPPVRNPPSKQAIMGLVKQARGFGCGVSLATQNPGDLDYKALSNIGTWFVGRLSTKRDRDKVFEGLQGAVSDSMIAGLGSREFIYRSPCGAPQSFRTLDSHIPIEPVSLAQAVSLIRRFNSYYYCKTTDSTSAVAGNYDEFLEACKIKALAQHELRTNKTNQKLTRKIAELVKKQESILAKLEAEEDRKKQRGLSSAVSLATTIMSLFGSKPTTTVGRAGSALKHMERTKASQDKIAVLEEKLAGVREEIKTTKASLNQPIPTVEINEHKLWESFK